MSSSRPPGRRRPGPRRPVGAPSGPDEVRRAVLDAAGTLFAERGVDAVSLRDIAAAADVQLVLISRYVGTRDELVTAVLDDLSAQVARSLTERPTEPQSFEPDSPLGRWTRLLAHVVLTSDRPPTDLEYNPVLALAEVAEREYGVDPHTARIRGAQIVASGLGWRIFERYLVAAAGLGGDAIPVLRSDLHNLHRRVAATTWPSPDPPPRRGA